MDHLLGFGIPLSDAVRMAAESCLAQSFRHRMQQVANRVTHGDELMHALAEENALPQSAGWLVGQAEARQFPPGSLAAVARCLERALNRDTGTVVGALEPVCMVFIGTIVGLSLLALFLPEYQLIGQLH
jgi:type IV pilus assembly protein PilC